MVNEAKRRAGLATLAKYGHEHYVEIGSKAGRPRNLSLAEIRQQQSQIIIKEGNAKGVPHSLATLSLTESLRLLKHRNQEG